jgi:hypothetical protein
MASVAMAGDHPGRFGFRGVDCPLCPFRHCQACHKTYGWTDRKFSSSTRRRPHPLDFRLLAIILALPALPVRDELVQIVRHVVGLGTIAAIAWVIILLADVFGDALYARHRTDIADNLTARRIRTQIAVLRRIFTLLVIVIPLPSS